MSNCPSCGGVLGRDCFNPIECAQITASINAQQNCNCGYENLLGELEYVRGVDMPAMEQTIQEGCNIISNLIDLLPPEFDCNNEVLKYAENFYRQHYIITEQQQSSTTDDLPF